MSDADDRPRLTKSQPVFAPILTEFEIPDKDRLNGDLMADIAKWREQEQGITRSNVSGWHSAGNIYARPEEPFVRICRHFVEACKPVIARFMTFDTFQTKKLNCQGWVNVNPQHAYNQIHTHDEYDLSGVYYVKVPEPSHKESGALQFLNPSYRGGPYSELFKAMNPSTFTVTPREGTMLIFPSAMPHWVLPNDENEDRISIAFNLRIS